MTNSQKNIDYVLRTIEERDIRFVRLWFTDVSGNLKSFAISPEDLEEAFDEGIGFDGSAVDGFASVSESDMLAFPDATTFQILPWRPTEKGVARIFCDIKTPKREPFSGDPRNCLRRLFRYADKQGYIPNIGPQIEYFYFEGEHSPKPLDGAGYFDLTPGDSARDLRRSTVLDLENLSIPVEYSYHALAPSQHGLSLRYAEALSCADNLMTARLVVKQMAYEDGAFASFMPKPLKGQPGSSMFLHQSIFDTDGNNIFWGPDRDAFHLSEYAHAYIAGLIKYAPEYCLVTNPTVNSYKRLVPSVNVPTYATWGRRNRAALVRIPLHKPGKHASTRVELRLPDPSCNPYLAIAATVAAGLKGIDEGLTLPAEYEGYETEREMAQKGYERLPRTLGEALDRFRESDLMQRVLGDHIFDFMVRQKEQEWFDYNSSVTDWEMDRYYAGF